MTYLIKSQPKNVKFARVYYSTTNDSYTPGLDSTTQIRIDTISGESGLSATVSSNSIVLGEKKYIIITKPHHLDTNVSGNQIQTRFYWNLNGTKYSGTQVEMVNEGYASTSPPNEIGVVPVGALEIDATAGDVLTLQMDSTLRSNTITLKWNCFGIFILEVDK